MQIGNLRGVFTPWLVLAVLLFGNAAHAWEYHRNTDGTLAIALTSKGERLVARLERGDSVQSVCRDIVPDQPGKRQKVDACAHTALNMLIDEQDVLEEMLQGERDRALIEFILVPFSPEMLIVREREQTKWRAQQKDARISSKAVSLTREGDDLSTQRDCPRLGPLEVEVKSSLERVLERTMSVLFDQGEVSVKEKEVFSTSSDPIILFERELKLAQCG